MTRFCILLIERL